MSNPWGSPKPSRNSLRCSHEITMNHHEITMKSPLNPTKSNRNMIESHIENKSNISPIESHINHHITILNPSANATKAKLRALPSASPRAAATTRWPRASSAGPWPRGRRRAQRPGRAKDMEMRLPLLLIV